MDILKEKLLNLLCELYEGELSHEASLCLLKIVSKHQDLGIKNPPNPLDEKSALLITYPDQIQSNESGKSAIKSFAEFYNNNLAETFSGVHFLPFFPSSSDGGFSVVDYCAVEPEYGDWQDFAEFKCDLMFDAVFNHSSPENHWFKKWQSGDKEFENFYHYFHECPAAGSDMEVQIKNIIRPRNSDVLTPYKYKKSDVYVWTTFSDDQVDLDMSNYKVLAALVDVLLLYVEKHANYIRIDAVPFLWKRLGTTCMSLPEVHTLVKVFRTVLDMTYPEVKLITESNVPHKENISYFGESEEVEAQLVYNFSLAPLILYSIWFETAESLQHWSQSIESPKPGNAFFNFTATHDGVGVRPLEGIVPDEDVAKMCEYTSAAGGLVSYRKFDRGEKPYELNITWASAMQWQSDDLEETFDKFMLSHAICLAFPGVPGMYFHNLLGTFNWNEGYEQTHHRRDINRKKFTRDGLDEVMHSSKFHDDIFKSLSTLLKIRTKNKVFHPDSWKIDFNIPSGDVFIIAREFAGEFGLFVFNLTGKPISFSPTNKLSNYLKGKKWHNLITEDNFNFSEEITLKSYEFLWLQS